MDASIRFRESKSSMNYWVRIYYTDGGITKTQVSGFREIRKLILESSKDVKIFMLKFEQAFFPYGFKKVFIPFDYIRQEVREKFNQELERERAENRRRYTRPADPELVKEYYNNAIVKRFQ